MLFRHCCFCWRSRGFVSFQTLAAFADPLIPLLELLSISIETKSLNLSQQSQGRAIKSGLTQHPLVAQKLISSLCAFNRPYEAQSIFDPLSIKTVHICNTLLSGYGRNHLIRESIELFREMCCGSDLPLPDEFSFSAMFKIIGDSGSRSVSSGKMLHGMSVKNSLVLDTVVGNSLMSTYRRCGFFSDALKVFDEIPVKNVSSWNAVISGYAALENIIDSYTLWDFVKRMQSEGVKFDSFTVSTLLSKMELAHGRELHCYTVKNTSDLTSVFSSDAHLGCCLIDMYSKNDKVEIGRKVFETLKCKNVFIWTAMINGYVNDGDFIVALHLFRKMQWNNGIEPNEVSLIAILPACSCFSSLIGCKQVHGNAVRRELHHHLSLCNTLIDTYSKSGSLISASRVFDFGCPKKDSISWSSIISAYGLHGRGRESVTLFDNMQKNGFKPDETVVTGVLSACCRSGLVNDGLRIYDSVVNTCRIELTAEICGCVVDMLARSGQLHRALDFIKTMPVKAGPSIWGSLVSASGVHGDWEVRDMALAKLVEMEPENPSNYVSISNVYAASERWEVVAEVRRAMREKGLKKNRPGCSWISVGNATHCFVAADRCSDSIRSMIGGLVSTMKMSYVVPDFVYLWEFE